MARDGDYGAAMESLRPAAIRDGMHLFNYARLKEQYESDGHAEPMPSKAELEAEGARIASEQAAEDQADANRRQRAKQLLAKLESRTATPLEVQEALAALIRTLARRGLL